MRPVLNWIDKITEDDNSENGCCIYDLAFKPDGSELLVAADTKVLVYDGSDGTLLQSLKGHKDLVYCVAFSHNGERFASGSADRTVIIWTEQHEGTLKYTHNESVQCLAFSPVGLSLLSCSMNDYGLWTQAEKSVSKQRTASRCTSCAWSTDGQSYAVGLFDGTVTIRNASNGEETCKIERPSGEPVWSMAFSPSRSYSGEILAVADWGQSIAFYDLQGAIVSDRTSLGFDPTAIDYCNAGQFLVITGSNHQVLLYSREGTTLGTVAQMDTWAWTVRAKPSTNTVVVGCVDGTLACYQLMFGTVHGLHRDRYAFREHMTDVVVQHLSRHVRVRIRCNDLVRKVAVYHQRLAIQLSDRVHIYRQVSGDGDTLEYRMVDRIVQAFECSLLVVTAQHLILCQEKRLQCYDMKGLKQREWQLEALIRYIKVIGGPAGREAILIGLKNGQVCKIFVDNPFPVQMLQIKNAVRCLDISHLRRKLAIVDEHGVCLVYDASNRQLLFQEPNTNSVAWNTDNEHLLCYSGNGILSMKAQNLPAYQQRMQGFVVGFSGKRVFCLYMYAMSAVEVPLSNQLYQYIEKQQFEEAYELASLGVTENEWAILAGEALVNLNLEVAAKAYYRIKDTRFLQLINEIEDMRSRGETKDVLMANICAYQGRFRQAAQLYQDSANEQRALDLFTDLRMFDQAQELLSTSSGDTQRALIRKRADWAENSNQPRIAAEMFIAAGDHEKALDIILENNWTDVLVDLMRRLDRGEVDLLRRIGAYLVAHQEYTLAQQLFISLNDIKSLINMHVTAFNWTDAFALAQRYPNFVSDVYLPYARWLAEHDRFEEAQRAYHKAGRQVEALRVLEQLTENAVRESRFLDAGYYYWMLSTQYLDRSVDDASLIDKFEQASRCGECYYAYDAVHRYLAEPFTSRPPEALINMARFLLFQPSLPKHISKVSILYTLAKQGKALGAYKLARYALDQLAILKAPERFEKPIALATLMIRAKPFTDNEELMPMCYRCGTLNALTTGANCTQCSTSFIYSFVSFEVLPVVEFECDEDISIEEAKKLINSEPPLNTTIQPFQTNKNPGPIHLNRSALTVLERSRVTIAEWPSPLKPKFYYNMIPQISVSICQTCRRMFHLDDYELAVLQEGHCPFCRTVYESTATGLLDEVEIDLPLL